MDFRIIIVDEDSLARRRYADQLIAEAPPPGASYKITTLNSVAAALLQASRQHYHLVIASLRVGSGGLELAGKLREFDRDVRLLFLHDKTTGSQQIERAQQLGGRLIESSSDAAMLRDAVAEALYLRAAPRAAPVPLSAASHARERSKATAADVQLLLDVLRRQASAQLALYTDSIGNIVAQCGDDRNLDVPSLASLISGGFVNALELGRTLRDSNTVHLSVHEGIHYDVYSANVGNERLAALIFDKQRAEPKLGMVWLLLKRAAAQLTRMREGNQHAHEQSLPVEGLAASLNDEFDRLFGDELVRNGQ